MRRLTTVTLPGRPVSRARTARTSLRESPMTHTVKQLADEARRPGARDMWTHDRNRAGAVTVAAGVA
ncbi:hypothetical protein Aca07nite_12920 [Actinoplanes capillaceus]|uniref:Uncharacterized protein n=1 Tax=Actinoplanes campanulatus TaxID=113559 RepID=A0ABQ3WAJ6_9ACTN|nr:hypothetical protein Aca07nite_12920 [Actinoplanes capillaceus]